MSEFLPQVSEAELEILRSLWAVGSARVRDLLAVLPEGRWAYTTVQTLLHRLQDKGFVARDKTSGITIYTAVVSREQLLQRRLADLSDELADGSVVSMLHGIVSGKKLSRTEIDEVRGLLDDLEHTSSKRKKPPTRRHRGS